jgi:hypothetical protein
MEITVTMSLKEYEKLANEKSHWKIKYYELGKEITDALTDLELLGNEERITSIRNIMENRTRMLKGVNNEFISALNK